eukprot:6187998-Pleurochrysis_carterae.AAC.1
MLSAPAAVSAARMHGRSQSGAWSATRGHHAGPAASPQSAGFSSIHGTPASCAASTSSAANAARRLCLATYRAHLRGMGSTPSGRSRL